MKVPWPILQPQCLRCFAAHDEMLQANISYGLLGCQVCSYVPPVYFDFRPYEQALDARRHADEYRAALRTRFSAEER